MFIALGEKSVHPATLVSPSSSTRDVHVSTAYPAKENTVSPGRHLIEFKKRDALASDRMMLNRKRLAGSAVLIFSMYSDVNMLTPRWPSAKSMTAWVQKSENADLGACTMCQMSTEGTE